MTRSVCSVSFRALIVFEYVYTHIMYHSMAQGHISLQIDKGVCGQDRTALYVFPALCDKNGTQCVL